MKEVYVGIDVGSVSTNVVATDKENNLFASYYLRTNGQPIEAARKGLKKLYDYAKGDIKVLGIGTTGSGRQLTGIMVGADVIKNEITAHATATVTYAPDTRTIFEIGGQDSKIILLKDGMVTDFAMNTVCAAGTGSFLEHQSERLKIPIEEFGDYALTAKKSVRIAGRCTVFAESDMIAKQQFGFSKAEIINGLCEALVRNYINNLGRGKKLDPPYVFQGGVAANKGIIAAFERELNHEVRVLKNFDVMGAIGAAILSKEAVERSKEKTKFRGFECAELEFVPSSFVCDGCDNSCEVIKIVMDGKVVAMWGDRCGKWTNSII